MAPLTLNQTVLLSATTGTIDCLITPVTGRQLLLPNTVVAEVVSGDNLTPQTANSTPWSIGSVNWRDSFVPVVTFEGLNGLPAPHECEYIAIIHSISIQHGLSHYGIVVRDIPRLARVKIAELEDLEGAVTGPVEFLQVRYAGELMVIPDLDVLEACLLAN